MRSQRRSRVGVWMGVLLVVGLMGGGCQCDWLWYTGPGGGCSYGGGYHGGSSGAACSSGGEDALLYLAVIGIAYGIQAIVEACGRHWADTLGPMAWITKNSGTMQIARREEPYFTPAMKREMTSKVLPRYETKLACTMPGLHLIQHEYGWVPAQAMEELAEFLGLAPADVLDCASFYEEYWLKPKGKHLIGVCRSIACEFCGQPDVTEAIKAKLAIDVGDTTEDGRFTLIELECLGACGGGPAILIDEALHENVKPGDVGSLIDSVKDSGHH